MNRMKRFIYLIFIGIVAAGFAACSDGNKKAVTYTPKTFVKAKKVESPKPVVSEENKQMPEYVIKGERDPFKLFTIGITPEIAEGKEQYLSPLQKLTLSQIRLVGIIWGSKKSALIQDFSGIGYIVKEGMFVGENSGIVTRISPNGITIKQHFKDYRGRVNTREAVLSLRKEEGEK